QAMTVDVSETARYADSANSRQVRRNSEDIGEIHLQWVSDAFAQLKRRHWRSRRDQCIDFLKRLREIAPNQFPHFLRAQIIGVVITGAQNVRAENNPPFHFRSETFLARAAIEIEHVFRVFCSISVTDPIKASKVRRSLGGGHNVINSDRVFSVRE